jgi:hypothetical protein
MNQLKRNELQNGLLEKMDEVLGVVKPNPGYVSATQKFLEFRNKEVWDEKQVTWLFNVFAEIAFVYHPEGPKTFRLAQETATKIMAHLTVATTTDGERDPEKRIAYGPTVLGYVKLSDGTIEKLNQCYADFYLMRHKEPKAIQILEALPFITQSRETMAWFVARIVNVSRKKSLRLSLEKDLALAGMKLLETKRSFSVVYSHISSEDEATIRADSETAIDLDKKKNGGGLS